MSLWERWGPAVVIIVMVLLFVLAVLNLLTGMAMAADAQWLRAIVSLGIGGILLFELRSWTRRR